MSISAIVVPEYDEQTDFSQQYIQFMDTYKLWKPEEFLGKMITGREYHKLLIVQMSSNIYITKNDINRYSYKLLEWAIKKYKKDSVPVWLSEEAKYQYKTMITVNLPDDRTLTDAVECASSMLSAMSWVERAEYVVEYHTEQGNHPHAHIIVMTGNARYKSVSNVVCAIKDMTRNKWKLSVLNKYIEWKNHPAVKITPYNPNSDKYLDGDKKAKKCLYVEMDSAMRKELRLEEKYYYNK